MEETPGRASLEKLGCRTPPQLHAGGVGQQQQHKKSYVPALLLSVGIEDGASIQPTCGAISWNDRIPYSVISPSKNITPENIQNAPSLAKVCHTFLMKKNYCNT